MARKHVSRSHASRALTVLAALALLVASAIPAAAVMREGGSRGATESASTYIVQLADAPVAGYEGDISGLAATAPANGRKLNVRDQNVQRYVAHLSTKHDDAAAAVGASRFYDYYYSFNGFAAKLSGKQANALRKRADVVSVEKDRLEKLDTADTPAYLGLSDPGTGLWDQAGGVANAGEGMVVGIVDTGIWPEHPSFSPEGFGPPPAGWNGSCQSGELFSQKDCNNKLVGARYYLSGFGHFGIETQSDVLSARDYDSHGTHTSSTAVGNHNVATTGDATAIGATVSGMAPRARVAAYKVCWNGDAGGCATSDSVAAIDQAVADGVDAINFSISGTSTLYLNAVEVAFLYAARANVFVATSAGNSGPGAGTVAHISPWLASVAAGTHRSTTATVTLGNGQVFTGASVTSKALQGTLQRSQASGLAGQDPNLVRQCFSGTLDPAKVTGKVILCERGGAGPLNARVDKSAAVKQAGGIGAVIANISSNSLNADIHTLPTVHVDHIAWAQIAAYLNDAAAPTAALSDWVKDTRSAPQVAGFSSRGPSRAGAGDILKPDFMAPGVDVLAGVSPRSGRSFDLFSGTSMASPHVAGLGTLLKQLHPTWSPAAIRSALATSASTTVLAGSSDSPFAIGSGQVRPNLANDPGLVYDASFASYLGFLKGQGLCCASSTTITAIDASNLNQPTIAIGDLAGVQTVTRTVTNVGDKAATYSAKIDVPGVDATVTPKRLTLAPGESKSFTVRFTRDNATLNAYTFGALTWSDGTHTVRSRIALRPVAIAAPASRTHTTASGGDSLTVMFGYDGDFTATPQGLVAAAKTPGSVADDPTNDFNTSSPDSNQGTTVHEFTVPAGTGVQRFSLFDSAVDGAHDLDVYVYRGSTLAGASGGGTSQEQVTLTNPTAGTYRVYIHGWQTAGGGTANYTLFSWTVGPATGNLTVTAPASATTGGSGTVEYGWTGLATATRYLGRISYGNGTSEVGGTLIQINVP